MAQAIQGEALGTGTIASAMSDAHMVVSVTTNATHSHLIRNALRAAMQPHLEPRIGASGRPKG